MEVSLNWLNELVDLKDIDVKQIAHEMMNIYIQEETSWIMYELSWNKYTRLI